MTEARHALARFGNFRRVDFGEDHARLVVVRFRDHFAPWRDDEAVAIGIAAAFMFATLRGREHEEQVRNREGNFCSSALVQPKWIRPRHLAKLLYLLSRVTE